MAAAPTAVVRRELIGLAHRGSEVRALAPNVARILGRAVPLDGVCLLTMDPLTLLPTGELVHNGLPSEAMPRMADIEIAGTDFNAFATLVRTKERVASLSQATSGDLDRSARHRELKRPSGLGDELRAVLSTGRATWGGLTVLRAADRHHFTFDETAMVASVAGHVAEVLRRSMLLAALDAEPTDLQEPTGLILLAPDHEITHVSASARRWLERLSADGPRERLPAVVAAVAHRARDIVAGRHGNGPVALARVPTPSGEWLTVRGMTLNDDSEGLTAVLISPALSHELAPMIADAYDLTTREREVTQLVARGMSTDAIAEALHISPWTTQDHLKSIFDKVGVGTRGELVARVFFKHHAPRIATVAPEGRRAREFTPITDIP